MLEVENRPLNLEYRHQLESVTKLLRGCGYEVRAYQHPHLPHFSRLSHSQQHEVLQALMAYGEALAEVCEFDDNIDMRQFIWRFLVRLGIAPSEDLFSTLENESFIQIYNLDELQIFRSLRCFERCSFTLEELTSKSWYELWHRDSLFFYALTGLVTKIIRVMKPTKLRLDFPYHTVREIDSECLFDFRYKIKTVSILTRKSKALAAVLIEDWKY